MDFLGVDGFVGSWSGNRSKQVAEFLSSWLEQVIQATETWISADITKGERWSPSISDELEATNVGIICLDKDNLDSNWILFEAGALSKMKNAMVCTFLLDVQPSDVEQPLGQFQHTLFDKEDIWKLVQDINQKLLEVGEKQVSERNLKSVFDRFYPDLEKELKHIASTEAQKKSARRSDHELLEEVLQTVRAIKYDLSKDKVENESLPKVSKKEIEEFLPFIRTERFRRATISDIEPQAV